MWCVKRDDGGLVGSLCARGDVVRRYVGDSAVGVRDR